MTPQDKLYNLAAQYLGQHLTLDNSVPSIEGCAEAVSFLLQKRGYSIPQGGIPTVNGLIAWALQSGHFVEINHYEYGCLITAHQPNYYNGDWAHIGVTLKKGIGSNNSFGGATGLFTENYTQSSWNDFFHAQHGSVIRYFKPIS